MRFSLFKKSLLIAGCFLAGRAPACAQKGLEVTVTGGGHFNRNTVSYLSPSSGFAFDYYFSLKANQISPGKGGVGFYYEALKLSMRGSGGYSYTSTSGSGFTSSTSGSNSYNYALANPQHALGITFYRKLYVSGTSYFRLEALFGLVGGSYQAKSYSRNDESWDWGGGGGVDVSYVFPLSKQLNAALNAGGRYSEVSMLHTFSFPLSVGLNFKLENNHWRGPAEAE